MKSNNFSHQLFLIFTVSAICSILLVLSNTELAFAAKKSTSNQNCEVFYSLYKDIGESKFRDRYQKIPSISNCLKLYKSSSWNFMGKAATDLYFDSLKSKQKSDQPIEVKINILSKDPTGKLKYVIKFEACPNQTVPEPYFLIKSDGYKYLATSGVIQNNKCTIFRAEINAVSPSTIAVEYVKEPGKHEHLKIKRLSLV